MATSQGQWTNNYGGGGTGPGGSIPGGGIGDGTWGGMPPGQNKDTKGTNTNNGAGNPDGTVQGGGIGTKNTGTGNSGGSKGVGSGTPSWKKNMVGMGFNPMENSRDSIDKLDTVPEEFENVDASGIDNIRNRSLVYKTINLTEDVVKENKVLTTRGIWGPETGCKDEIVGSMFTFFTSSYQTEKQKEYYYNVYIDPNLESCEHEFSIAYGHYNGLGGYSGGGQLNDSPTRAIYSQYSLLCDIEHPDWENIKFKKGNVLSINSDSSTYTKSVFWAPDTVTNPDLTTQQTQDVINDIMSKPPRFIDLDGGFFDDIYVINISKKRLKDRLDPGNWELALHKLFLNTPTQTSEDFSILMPSFFGEVITLVDDSMDANQDALINKKVDAFYGIYSGSISNGIHSKDKHYGYVYPNLGIIVLGASKLDSDLGFNTNREANVNGDNNRRLFMSISASATPIGPRTKLYSFDARNVKYKTTTHYFLRANNKEFNYSNNPTFRSGSLDELRHPTFIEDPKTYITTIGLYNRMYELIAVAKVSKPILKSFTNEMSVVVKLEY